MTTTLAIRFKHLLSATLPALAVLADA